MYADESIVQYNYNEWNRPTSVYRDAITGYVGTSTTPGIEFDAIGNIQQLAYQDVLQTTMTLTYDVRNRLDTLSAFQGQNVVFGLDYTYDYVGNIIGLTTTNGGAPRTDIYGYDGVSRLTSYSLGDATTTYSYDGRSNRTHENGARKWWYDDANVLTYIGGREVSTDASGNMIAKPVDTTSMWTMNYDKQNQLLEVEQDNQTQLVNLYDATGKRIRKIEGNRETVYVYIGNNVVYEQSADVFSQADSSVTTYIEVAGRTVAKRTDGATEFMITDHLGSTRVILDTNGIVLRRFDYKPFGEDLVATTERGEKVHRR